MRERLLVGLFMLCAVFSRAFEWPVENKLLISTFGGSEDTHFRTGIELSGNEQPVFPIADGEVLFYYIEGSSYHSVPRGNGSFLVLQHEGDIQSVYSRLKPESVNRQSKRLQAKPASLAPAAVETVRTNQQLAKEEQALLDKGLVRTADTYSIKEDLSGGERARLWSLLCRSGSVSCVGFTGETGQTGAVDSGRLYLSIFDIKEDLVLNPLHKSRERSLLNPPLEAKRETNTAGPLIKQVFLKRGEGKATRYEEITNNQLIKAGEAELVVHAYTGIRHGATEYPMAPFRFSVFLSGREVTNVNFYALQEKDGKLVIWKTDTPCKALYADEWLYRLATLKLVEGNVLLQIKIEDLFGRETTRDYNLKVSP